MRQTPRQPLPIEPPPVGAPRGAVPAKLLFVVNEARFFNSHRLPIAAAARAAGYDVHVATPAGEGEEKIRAAGLHFHAIPLDRGGMNPLRDAATLIALVRLFRRLRPDLVHLVTIKPVLYGGIAARLTRIPAVVSAVSGLGFIFIAQGPIAYLRAKIVGWAYRLALHQRNGRIILQNNDDLAELRRVRAIVHAKPALIRGSGVDLEQFVPRPEPAAEPLVILASRMLWDKGVGEFVEAARLLKLSGARARFALVGGVDAANPAAITARQLSEWVSAGTVEWWNTRDDMPTVFAGCHIVCLPSYREGLPRVLIEAAACGRPIVATDVPGCREAVRHGENGLLVAPRDAGALAQALRTLLENSDMRQRMGRRGREIAEAEFSLTHVVRDTLAVYRELLSS